jgi:hypothetical protein
MASRFGTKQEVGNGPGTARRDGFLRSFLLSPPFHLRESVYNSPYDYSPVHTSDSCPRQAA